VLATSENWQVNMLHVNNNHFNLQHPTDTIGVSVVKNTENISQYHKYTTNHYINYVSSVYQN